MTSAIQSVSALSVGARLALWRRRYQSAIVDSDASSASAGVQTVLQDMLREAAGLWAEAYATGAVSPNEVLAELPTTTLQLLLLPYLIGDAWERMQGSDGGDGGDDDDDDGQGRARALAVSMSWFRRLFAVAVDVELLTERELLVHVAPEEEGDEGMRRTAAGPQRTARIALSQQQSALQREIDGYRDRAAYQEALQRRARRLVELDGGDEADAAALAGRAEADETAQDDDDDARALAEAELRWAVCDAMRRMSLSARELQLLGGLPATLRAQIAQAYQDGVREWASRVNAEGRQSYTILPGGRIATHGPSVVAPPGVLAAGGGAIAGPSQVSAAAVAATVGAGSSYSLVGCAVGAAGSAATFREQVRAELMLERNQPTMLLADYAAMEMAGIEDQMRRHQEQQEQQRAEDEALGEEGIEERERQKQAAWDDWRDANPPMGITNKGNYT